MGDFNLSLPQSRRRGKDVDILEDFIHPQFQEGKSYFDVGIARTTDFAFANVIQPICLPSNPNTDPNKYDDRSADLLGKLVKSHLMETNLEFSQLFEFVNYRKQGNRWLREVNF